MIKNIVLDVGGVILDDSAFTKARDNLDVTKLRENKVSFSKCLLGKMEVAEFINILRRLGKEYEEYATVLSPENYEKNLPVINETVELMYKLKEQGYKIYIFSNITQPTLEYLKKKVDIENLVDDMVCSHIEHFMKPDVKFYERLIQKLNLNKNETIFFDDKIKNVEVGNSVGIKSVKFNSTDDILRSLENREC